MKRAPARPARQRTARFLICRRIDELLKQKRDALALARAAHSAA